MIPPPESLSLSDSGLENSIGNVPGTLGIYLLTPESGDPYLGWSGCLSKRLTRLLLGPPGTDSNLFAKLRARLIRVEYWVTASRLETSLLLYWLARRHDPVRYRQRLKLRTPWLVEFLVQDPFPRLSVQNRHITADAITYGPFASRDIAERFQQGVQSLFQIRRCDDRLAPHQDHPGCIYGEMNQCMRPCQLAVSVDEYAAEADRVTGFLASKGKHAANVLAAARDRACDETDFEQAARIHREIEKMKAVGSFRDALVTEIRSLNGVALTPGRDCRSVALWPMISGYWQEPLYFDFSQPSSEAKSLDRQLKQQLTSHLSASQRDGDRLEQVALLSRWYYSTWCDGVWFPFRSPSDLDYRALVRRISAMLRDSEQTGEATPDRTLKQI